MACELDRHICQKRTSSGTGFSLGKMMRLTFHRRVLLMLVPHFALLAVLGGAGVVLLSQLGGQIDQILRDNYESIVATEQLNEALERIDSSFQFTLAGYEEKGREQYQDNWRRYQTHLER